MKFKFYKMKKLLGTIGFCMILGLTVLNAQDEPSTIGGETSCSATRTCFRADGVPDGSVTCKGDSCKRTPNGVECDTQVTNC